MTKYAWLGGSLGLLSIVAAGIYGAHSSEEGSWWAAALLSLSLFFEFVILTSDKGTRLVGWLISVESLKLLLGGIYWYLAVNERPGKPALLGGHFASGFSFALAVVLVVVTFRLTVKELGERDNVLNPSQKTPAQHLFPQSVPAKLCGVLLAFLHITYFMTFALAIEDKVTNGRSLHKTAGFVTPRDDTNPPVELDSQSTCKNPRRDLIRRFYFARGKSELNLMNELEKRPDAEKIEQDICLEGEQPGRETVLWRITDRDVKKASSEERLDIRAAAWNLRQKCELRNLIDQFRKENRKCRVQLQGHATEEPPSGRGNNSNFERSLTRAQHMKRIVMELSDKAGMPTPEWEVAGVGADTSFLEADQTRLHDVELDPQLSVEVLLRALPTADQSGVEDTSRKLALLDYTYFMIYTITTTGNGDLVPSSSFARFLTSMANLFELFFLVIIVNLVIILNAQQ